MAATGMGVVAAAAPPLPSVYSCLPRLREGEKKWWSKRKQQIRRRDRSSAREAMPAVANSVSSGKEVEVGRETQHCCGRRQALTLAIGGCVSLVLTGSPLPEASRASALTIAEVTPQIQPAATLLPAEAATVALFEKNTFSVVNVVDVTLRGGSAGRGAEVDIPEGNGSGIVWDSSGNIVTNYHVVGSSLRLNPKPGTVIAQVTVLGRDGYQQTFPAKLVGAERTRDLAVLKVDAPASLLVPISVGQSSALRVGQRCLAIGNPFGFDHTLTTGVIGGLDRDIQSQAAVTISGGIQTDAAINPGNSGGPLLDSAGRLIGINTAIFTRSGTSAGVGFAIPIDTVARIVRQLIDYGKVVQPGLNVQFASARVAQQLRVTTGALVLSVPTESAAGKAGLLGTRRGLTGIQSGDVIIAIDGAKVSSTIDLAKAIDARSIGDPVKLHVIRGVDSSSPEELDISFRLEQSMSS